MAVNKSIQFLPEIFRTETNQKFLNATVDQLISEPNLKKVNGYIGRKLAPSFKSTDNYITEISAERQNYQLESSVVIKNPVTEQIEFATTYSDLINQITYHGGIADNHDRLFKSEYYTYDPRIDFDKLINFSQYYWLENGPTAVPITAAGVPLQFTYNVVYDSVTKSYSFTDQFNIPNPTITLARGGIYDFVINDPGNNFFIQTRPGSSGVDPANLNISTREVFGVENNGTDFGVVRFIVPPIDGQINWTSMILAGSADYATLYSYKDIQGCSVDDLNNILGGIDGPTSEIIGKFIIFANQEKIDDEFWNDTPVVIVNGVAKFDAYDAGAYDLESSPYENVEFIPAGQKNDIFLIEVYPDELGVDRIILIPTIAIEDNQKVRIRAGDTFAGQEFYSETGLFKIVPTITAPNSILYYQNSAIDDAAGVINLVDPAADTIDPDQDIVGKVNYTSPRGVVFTNGLKVTFDSTATAAYQNKTYYVEGVGSGIRLILADDLTGDELDNDLSNPDYITINRASIDLNAWTRTNRWFHVDVITKTAGYLSTTPIYNQDYRAKRPIIEFEADLQLYNFGSLAKKPVQILDTIITSAFTQVQGAICVSPAITERTFTVGSSSVTLQVGDRVVFANDENLDVRNKIYVFDIVQESISPLAYRAYIEEADDAEVGAGHVLIVQGGDNGGKSWYYNGTNWISAQQKTKINQPPLFDVIDSNGTSLAGTSTYPGSSFTGTKIFSYKEGIGTNDPVLGFPLSYKNFIAQGDIEFVNNFDEDTFEYITSGGLSATIGSNFGLLQKNLDRTTSVRQNIWNIVDDFSKQFQIYDFVYDGSTNLFPIDQFPDLSENSPNLKVFINNQFVTNNNFAITQVVDKIAVLIDSELLNLNDAVFIMVYNSTLVLNNAFYEVPLNLDINGENQNLSLLTLGQMRNHLVALSQKYLFVSGPVPGDSNLRDLVYKRKGGSIIQNSSPVLYSSLFLSHPTMNFVNALRFANTEYTKFKTIFLDLATKLDIDTNNIAESVDTIIRTINEIKNKDFAFYDSNMVPYSSMPNNVLPEYTVFSPLSKSYELSQIFEDSKIQNKAVLVYLTRTINNVTTTNLLIKDQDFTFNQSRPAIDFSADFVLLYGDIIKIIEYSDTLGSFVPPTPTKLGLYPKYVPQKFFDDTYRGDQPLEVIQGHDGSITPCFGDYRDSFLLELERRIYNNIKVSYNSTNFNLFDHIPGKFRNTGYTLEEYNKVISSMFLTWAGTYKIDFTTNDIFTASDPFTWNFKKFRDTINGEFLTGTWRSIYRYFYDTDRPHSHPWEMLGFSIKPDYWEDRYGPAPYTSGNALLWSDLSLGYIHAGERAGFDIRYQRPNLQRYIPVDESGNLVDPSKILVVDFDSNKANTSYAVGDIGPAENAWRKSSEYPYAVIFALSLMRPAMFFSLLIDVNNYNRNLVTSQFVFSNNGQHISPTLVTVNGYQSNNTTEYSQGYLNFIVDYMKNLGIQNAAQVVKTNLSRLTKQFTYRVGGFTDKKYIKLLAEQSSPTSINDSIIIPDENYRIELYKGAPLDKVKASAIIIEKSAAGYTVSGFDTNEPYFSILPVFPSNNSYVITQSNVRAVIYKDFKKNVEIVPYGFEFNTKQQVVNFLVAYQNYLVAKGFIFDEYEKALDSNLDLILSSKEFLHWSTQGWRPGAIIVLSPFYNSIKFSRNLAVVDEIKNTPHGSRVIDINGKIIKKNNFTVFREDGIFNLKSLSDQTIGFIELNAVQNEHILIIDNETVFNDVIYAPSLGNRQFRLKLIGAITADWSGSLELPGFLYSSPTVEEWAPVTDYRKGTVIKHKEKLYTALQNIVGANEFQVNSWQLLSSSEFKTGIINNLATNAGLLANLYDIDNQVYDETLQLFSNGIIGFRERNYFSDLGVDVASQVKFYQGLLKQKGTNNALIALKGAIFNNINTNIEVYENWALRVGEYGALDDSQYVEIPLDEADIVDNPCPIQFVDSSTSPEPDIVTYEFSDLYKISGSWEANIFQTEDININYSISPLPNAGYVYKDDVDATIFDLNNYTELNQYLDTIGTGWKLWVAKDFNEDWNVLRADNIQGILFAVRHFVDDIVEFVHNEQHIVAVDDIVAIANFDSRFDGFYRVNSVIDLTRFTAKLYQNLDTLIKLQSVIGEGLLYRMIPMRVNYATDIIDITPTRGWITNDKIWVDNLDYDKNWGVYTKNESWLNDIQLKLSESNYSDFSKFGSTISISSDGLILYAAATGTLSCVAVFQKDTILDQWILVSTITTKASQIENLGDSLSNGDNFLSVGSYKSYSDQGLILVYKNQILQQIILDPAGLSGDKFGYASAMSADGKFLYVTSPGANKVYCYALANQRETSFGIFNGDGLTTRFTLPAVINNETLVVLIDQLNSAEFVPYKDYTLTQVQNAVQDYTYSGGPSNSLGNYYNVSSTSASGIAVTLQFATDRVTLNSHGLSNGDSIIFTSINTTTGISVYTPYYVINTTTNYFQISLTSGGGAVNLLTADGTATALFNRNVKFDINVVLVGPGVDVPFVIGQTYKIASPGTTDFVAIGAADNNSGTVFTATGTGVSSIGPSTTGTAYYTELNLARAGSGMTVSDTLLVRGIDIGSPLVATITEATDLISIDSHGLTNGDIIRFSSIPTVSPIALGIEAGRNYFVVGATTNNFQISETSGGITKAFSAITVTLTLATSRVGLTNHGFQNGDTIVFNTIITTTGITTATTYYVINKTNNNFQISLTSGGAAEVFLTGDGTGTLTQCSGIFALDRITSYSLPRRLTVTLRESSNKVELNDHGLNNGDSLYFTSISTTTGITTSTTYYVINKTLNDFQLATTAIGSAIDLLTADGTGILIVNSGDITVTVTDTEPRTDIEFIVSPILSSKIVANIRDYYYELLSTLPVSTEVIGNAGYGESIATNFDGSIIAVGAPLENSGLFTRSGSIYVYHRTVYKFITDGISGTYTLPTAFNSISSVKLNDTLLTENIDYYVIGSSIQFPPYGGPGKSQIIQIETNQFVFDQKLNSLQGTNFYFGSVIDMCSSGCNIVVSTTNYSAFNYQFGAVTRIVNVGRVYGTITGKISNPVITPGNSLVINNFNVIFNSTTLDSAIATINAANIPGVTAEKINNKIKINSTVITPGQKLDIKLGFGTILADLGIDLYETTQNIVHNNQIGERFGTTIALNPQSNILAVGSQGGDMYVPVYFDSNGTSFDNQSTQVGDVVKDVGSVYIYDLIDNPFESYESPSLFVLSQTLYGTNLASDNNFGKSIKIQGDDLFVGVANASYLEFEEAGLIYLYTNENSKPGWELIRAKEPRVSIDSIASVFTYDSESSFILDFYDYLDPFKGKILGIVDQELDYKENFDPANYNVTSLNNLSLNLDFYWAERHVGKIWWDLSQVRFIDYEQGSLIYRNNNWGSVFPGSQIKIYEWVESEFLPSQYVANGGNGLPKYPDDTAYSRISIVDPESGIIKQKYYYWVGNKTSVDPVVSNRYLSVKALESYISDPKNQDIPFVATLAPNSLSIYNSNNKLKSDKIILHIDLQKSTGQNLIHSEYELIKQGSGTQTFPGKIITKLKDSLSGFDSQGLLVPDVSLNFQDRYGILSSPRQSMFVDRLNALRIFIQTLNIKTLDYPILLLRTPTTLYDKEPVPTTGFDSQVDSFNELSYLDDNLLSDGYLVLVPADSENDNKWVIYSYSVAQQQFVPVRVQSYKTELFWESVDWYDKNFEVGSNIDYTVGTYGDIQSLTLKEKDIVKVLDNGNGQWLIYTVTEQLSLQLSAAQNATIVFKEEIYNSELGSGFDSNLFGTLGFDNQIGIELSSIFDSVYEEIFINDLLIIFNELFFAIISFVFEEQKQPNWIFKTSFIDVLHNLRKLEQIPNYVKDDQTFYENYINEIKPYRTKLREYLPIYDNIDEANGDWTDFDLPSRYNLSSQRFIVPSDTETLSTEAPYVNWYNNYAYQITDYIIGNVGINYTIAPNVEITGGGGSGATAISTVNLSTQKLTGIIVTNPGSGYTSTPTVTINGVGSGAIVYPILKNTYYTVQPNLSYNLVRTVNSTIKFDRVSYSSNIIPFVSDPADIQIYPTVIAGNALLGNLYVVGNNIVSYNNEAFLVNSQFGTADPFDYTKVTKIDSGNVLLKATDRIKTYYSPDLGMPAKVYSQLMTGIEYPGVFIKGPEYKANSFSTTGNIFSFNYTGLSITSGNVLQYDFVKLGFELDQSVRINGNYNFDFKNNGTFKIVSVDRDSMILTGEVIETTYRMLLDTPVTVYAGNIITQANTLGNAFVLKNAINSRYIDIIHSVTGFRQTTSTIAGSEISEVVSVGTGEFININGIPTTAIIQELYTGGNANVTLSYLDLETNVLDSNIYSTYTDSSLGVRPEDINIVGGAYVDTYSSHAPEELIPGRIFDSLQIKVFTTNSSSSLGYRIFHPMNRVPEFTRISANSSTALAVNLDISHTSMFVQNIDSLPKPNRAAGVPGVVFINGEKIHYYQHYDANDIASAVSWTGNTDYPIGTIVNADVGTVYQNVASNVSGVNFDVTRYQSGYTARLYSSNISLFVGNAFTVNGNLLEGTNGVNDVSITIDTDGLNVYYTASGTPITPIGTTYFTIGNVYADSNVNISRANLQAIYPNMLTQLRRGVDGTGSADIIIAGNTISDSSKSQVIPNAQVFSNTVTGNIRTTSNVTYKLRLTSNITANLGDYLTQFANTGNARILQSVTNGNLIAVDFVTGTFQTAANVGTRVNLVSITSGLSSTAANINNISILGSINANGNVVLTSVQILQSNIWEQFGSNLQNSTTLGAQFIRAEPSYTP